MDSKHTERDDELVALAFELWVAAGALLWALHPPALAKLKHDLVEWDERGPGWLDGGGLGHPEE